MSLPIVTGSGRSNTENKGVKVELAKTWIPIPDDVLKLRSFFLQYLKIDGLGDRLLWDLLWKNVVAENAHLEGGAVVVVLCGSK